MKLPAPIRNLNPVKKFLSATKSFGIVMGGPLVLLVAASAGIVSALRSVARFRVPSPAAIALSLLTLAYVSFLRPRILRWGPGFADGRQLPGDEVLPEAGTEIWHSMDIEAPVEDVWPWVAQIGQDRGGFYSYEWLENLAGCEMKNANEIHPEWQHREVGDEVRLHPEGGLPVSIFEPGVVIGLEGWGNFVVESRGPGRTRLISHSRIKRGWPAIVYALLVELPHAIMERQMLIGIKQRCERSR